MAVLPFNIPGFNPTVTPPKIKFPAYKTCACVGGFFVFEVCQFYS